MSWLAMPQLPFHEVTWHYPVPGSGGGFDYGQLLTELPGAVLLALVAPVVGYRRRDALLWLLFWPAGLRLAWIAGTRLSQLPYRDWPTRESSLLPPHHPLSRAANRFLTWRYQRGEREAQGVEMGGSGQAAPVPHHDEP